MVLNVALRLVRYEMISGAGKFRIETISHQVNRLTIQIDDSFDGFKNRHEQAVPRFQSNRFDSLVESLSIGRPFWRPPRRTRRTTLSFTGPMTSRR